MTSRATIATAVLVLATAAQAQPNSLTLACKGTTTFGSGEEAKPEPISMGIIVNFTTRTVQGFGTPGWDDYPVRITAANDVTVVFKGSSEILTSLASINGTIDRVTGDVEATSMLFNQKTSKVIAQTIYALQCRPAQRIF
jgi:hypothetical protein